MTLELMPSLASSFYVRTALVVHMEILRRIGRVEHQHCESILGYGPLVLHTVSVTRAFSVPLRSSFLLLGLDVESTIRAERSTSCS